MLNKLNQSIVWVFFILKKNTCDLSAFQGFREPKPRISFAVVLLPQHLFSDLKSCNLVCCLNLFNVKFLLGVQSNIALFGHTAFQQELVVVVALFGHVALLQDLQEVPVPPKPETGVQPGQEWTHARVSTSAK